MGAECAKGRCRYRSPDGSFVMHSGALVMVSCRSCSYPLQKYYCEAHFREAKELDHIRYEELCDRCSRIRLNERNTDDLNTPWRNGLGQTYQQSSHSFELGHSENSSTATPYSNPVAYVNSGYLHDYDASLRGALNDAVGNIEQQYSGLSPPLDQQELHFSQSMSPDIAIPPLDDSGSPTDATSDLNQFDDQINTEPMTVSSDDNVLSPSLVSAHELGGLDLDVKTDNDPEESNYCGQAFRLELDASASRSPSSSSSPRNKPPSPPMTSRTMSSHLKTNTFTKPAQSFSLSDKEKPLTLTRSQAIRSRKVQRNNPILRRLKQTQAAKAKTTNAIRVQRVVTTTTITEIETVIE